MVTARKNAMEVTMGWDFLAEESRKNIVLYGPGTLVGKAFSAERAYNPLLDDRARYEVVRREHVPIWFHITNEDMSMGEMGLRSSQRSDFGKDKGIARERVLDMACCLAECKLKRVRNGPAMSDGIGKPVKLPRKDGCGFGSLFRPGGLWGGYGRVNN